MRKECTDFSPFEQYIENALENISEDSYRLSWKLITKKEWEILKEQLEQLKLKARQV